MPHGADGTVRALHGGLREMHASTAASVILETIRRSVPRRTGRIAAPRAEMCEAKGGRKADSVPAQMWAEGQQGQAQSRCRCGRGEAIPGADMGSAVSKV